MARNRGLTREVLLEPRLVEAGEADALAVEVDAPQAESAVGPLRHHVVDVGAGLCSCLERTERRHHGRIGIDRGIGGTIRISPTAKQQPVGPDFRNGHSLSLSEPLDFERARSGTDGE